MSYWSWNCVLVRFVRGGVGLSGAALCARHTHARRREDRGHCTGCVGDRGRAAARIAVPPCCVPGMLGSGIRGEFLRAHLRACVLVAFCALSAFARTCGAVNDSLVVALVTRPVGAGAHGAGTPA